MDLIVITIKPLLPAVAVFPLQLLAHANSQAAPVYLQLSLLLLLLFCSVVQADADVLQERQKQQEEWDAAAAARADYVAKVREFYLETYGERAEEKEYTMTTVTVEQLLDVREEPYTA